MKEKCNIGQPPRASALGASSGHIEFAKSAAQGEMQISQFYPDYQ
jgi:hypothetical protein